MRKERATDPKASMEVHVMVMLVLGGLWDMETEAVTVTAEEGRDIEIECSHSNAFTRMKYFCKEACRNEDILIHTAEKNPNGKYSIRDEGNTFYVTISDLTIDDSGLYWCGIDRVGADTFSQVDLIVTERAEENPSQAPASITPSSNHSVSLLLTTVMCVAALLFVFLFTLCVLLVVKKWRLSREMPTDYATMMPGVRPEPEHHCRRSSPDRTDLSGFPPPPPDLCFHFTSKQRESTVTLGVGEYVNVSEQICHYQHLDLGRLEEHVYHRLHGNSGPKDRTRGKE